MLPEGERPLRVSDRPVRSGYRQLVVSVPMPQIARQAVGHLLALAAEACRLVCASGLNWPSSR